MDNIEKCVSELKTFSMLHQQYLICVLEGIIEYYKDSLLGLTIFGSYARGENRKNSDLDLLIILKKAPGFSERIKEFVNNIELAHESLGQQLYEEEDILCELSPYILSKEEALKFQPVYFDLTEHNKILFDPEGIISRIYGAEDFIPTEEYESEDAETAIKDAEFVLKTVEEAFKKGI
ncbi:nucleotidyltransferase domain-containing protein [Thermosediminibacter oceani]|uniref:DNA polymerase beta domain protein region n=1 Tax=Thermosediminibacter oceani (strain ATCC BAA-1034 / DSM 16646 / JW/IW-1228P) TaxID=555079 RepID=D9S0R9_THEOJ|nr:nucleotidyltransferase domain-containing protein [Thermosediminibacter oceani]ADL07083.1 DNA polymerase beta domain protein region [Thermosediminibacter oceani DSM 16646]